VNLQSDVELGATEQKFNLLVHREIQREYGLPGEVALTMPILVGLDGQRKMSKSLGNYVGITEPPDDIFWKIMSISDELMWSYYDLLTDLTSTELRELRGELDAGKYPPITAKMNLAQRIVADFHGDQAALHAANEFTRTRREKQLPSKMREYPFDVKGNPKFSHLIANSGLAESRSEAERLIRQGAVKWDGKRLTNPAQTLDMNDKGPHTLRVGNKPPILVRVGD